ncbi:MAG: potassium channel family protein [Betaproteobacteria bacterium]|nr:potassium channel family protein [Betaproteobacteria bacterium]
MPIVIALCLVLVVATTLVHYDVLALLSARLPGMAIAPRFKLVVVVLSAFVAHAAQIGMYAVAMWACMHGLGIGGFSGSIGASLQACLYFSAETFTSLGFGDIVPLGPLRLLAGVETLNGLLLIGWSASFTYLSMARFWDEGVTPAR